MELSGKNVAVLGGGTSGLSAARLAASRGANVTAFDSGPSEKLAASAEKFSTEGIELVSGDAALHPAEKFDLAVISPGIDASWPIGKAFAEASKELIGEIELAWRLSDFPVIAITGTNGKSTTTELIAHLFNETGKRSVPAGNFGYAFSDVVWSGEQYDWIALEVSSFQLETIVDFHPRISMWMNFAPDHMDRYAKVEDYRNAKLRIFENQNADDLAILKAEESLEVDTRTITFSAFSSCADYGYREKKIIGPPGSPEIDFSKTSLNGKHNAENIMAAIAAVTEAGVAFDETLVNAVESYCPPAHRCEVVGEKAGVIFVNDSKATNLHALESALRGQDSRVTLIVGGKEKGLDFGELNDVVADCVSSAVCIGEIAGQIAAAWGKIVPCQTAQTLESAVQTAFENRNGDGTILFSPGTSSFDMFSGYEERGNAFRNAVAALPD